MKIKENVTQYEDFKYVLQDTGNIYLGAQFSYEELLEQEMVPFKLKAILTHYILKEAAPDTTLESQFYYLTGGSFLYETFKQLKIRVKVQMQGGKNITRQKEKRIQGRNSFFKGAYRSESGKKEGLWNADQGNYNI